VSDRVLVVDDEKNITLVMQAMLEKAGFRPLVFNDSSEAIEALGSPENGDIETIITDLYMPGPGGMDILKHCQKFYPELPVVIITAYGTVEAAVSALKQGAFDFITKPFDQTELVNVVKKAVLTFQKRQKEPQEVVRPHTTAPTISSMIGASAQMQEIFKIIQKIAASPSTVLISGESGTGKELVAWEIHRNSDRVDKPFIKINCAAIPSALIESELFGHEKGAFTGAVSTKPGRFELAHEGTLFLDEVAEMPLEMQVKLLRVLQEQEFERVGGVSSIKVDVRIITATNKNLDEEVKAGRFREDLFYRLNVVPIHLPALRDRREDLEQLVKVFIAQFNERLKKSIVSVSPEAMNILRNYPWPGNIRQLENALERMILMCDGAELRAKDLPEEIGGSSSNAAQTDEQEPSSLKEIVKKQTQSLERDLIERALEETSGNVTRTAEKLGLSRKGLQLKMKELNIRRHLDSDE
jgi:nitrogen regulation protein NR(I)